MLVLQSPVQPLTLYRQMNFWIDFWIPQRKRKWNVRHRMVSLVKWPRYSGSDHWELLLCSILISFPPDIFEPFLLVGHSECVYFRDGVKNSVNAASNMLVKSELLS